MNMAPTSIKLLLYKRKNQASLKKTKNSSVKNIRYQYYLNQSPPLIGFENIDMFEAQRGYPLIVLVHKENPDISFYGRVGILDTLNTKVSTILKNHFQEMLNETK